MQNFVSKGDHPDVMYPRLAASGHAILIGAGLFGVSPTHVAKDTIGPLAVTGVYDLPKGVGIIVPGDKLHWDEENKILTPDAEAGPYVAVALIGASESDRNVQARLNGFAS